MRVCILGAGLSSLTLAKALVNQNIYVDLYAQKKINSLNKSRTIGISRSNIEFFNNAIINVDKIAWKLKKIEIFSDNLRKEKLINFENNKNELFSIIKNENLFDLLGKSLSKDKYFKRINSLKNYNFLDNYNLVINTDFTSPITKKYFSKKILKKYNSFAYTTILKHKKIDNETAVQIFTKLGPLAFLPISENETSIVYSFYNKKNENINNLIEKYNQKYKILKIEKINSFELKSLSLRSYYYDHILAFGDLLHRIHPLAGQGFNMTIRDIKILLEIIVSKQNLGLNIDSSVNYDFENKLKHKNFIFSNGIDLVHEFFNFERKTNSSFLSKSVQLLNKNHKINKFFTKIADRGTLV
ncbi:FAD-dependent monooxygenase [Pelagibacterales bacterium SAG-MED22]|nr:FAD-dependent monooxygenase [Pelagibacterales bacterium SAG-MED22]